MGGENCFIYGKLWAENIGSSYMDIHFVYAKHYKNNMPNGGEHQNRRKFKFDLKRKTFKEERAIFNVLSLLSLQGWENYTVNTITIRKHEITFYYLRKMADSDKVPLGSQSYTLHKT